MTHQSQQSNKMKDLKIIVTGADNIEKFIKFGRVITLNDTLRQCIDDCKLNQESNLQDMEIDCSWHQKSKITRIVFPGLRGDHTIVAYDNFDGVKSVNSLVEIPDFDFLMKNWVANLKKQTNDQSVLKKVENLDVPLLNKFPVCSKTFFKDLEFLKKATEFAIHKCELQDLFQRNLIIEMVRMTNFEYEHNNSKYCKFINHKRYLELLQDENLQEVAQVYVAENSWHLYILNNVHGVLFKKRDYEVNHNKRKLHEDHAMNQTSQSKKIRMLI
jgi:hypothetical protein